MRILSRCEISTVDGGDFSVKALISVGIGLFKKLIPNHKKSFFIISSDAEMGNGIK